VPGEPEVWARILQRESRSQRMQLHGLPMRGMALVGLQGDSTGIPETC
jgi:hypothetical protein